MIQRVVHKSPFGEKLLAICSFSALVERRYNGNNEPIGLTLL
jgi:hypothetical protein